MYPSFLSFSRDVSFLSQEDRIIWLQNSGENLKLQMLKQNLSHKMLQKLSPQQIQLMKLLQIPTATLEQRVKEELEANPALEEGEENEEHEIIAGADDTTNYDEEDFKAADDPDPVREEEFELDDYLTEYIEDDPSS